MASASSTDESNLSTVEDKRAPPAPSSDDSNPVPINIKPSEEQKLVNTSIGDTDSKIAAVEGKAQLSEESNHARTIEEKPRSDQLLIDSSSDTRRAMLSTVEKKLITSLNPVTNPTLH